MTQKIHQLRSGRCTSLCRWRSAIGGMTVMPRACICRDLKRISILPLGATHGRYGFLAALAVAPALATPVDWMNWLLLITWILSHNRESLHFWIPSHCGFGQHFSCFENTKNGTFFSSFFPNNFMRVFCLSKKSANMSSKFQNSNEKKTAKKEETISNTKFGNMIKEPQTSETNTKF